MNNFTFSKESAITNSRKVAHITGLRHDKLLSKIKGYRDTLEYLRLNTEEFFIESTYVNSKDLEQTCYLLTSKGCEMVANIMVNQLSQAMSGASICEKELQQEIAITLEKADIAEEAKNEILTLNYDKWKDEVTCILNKIAFEKGGSDAYKRVKEESYKLLEGETGAKLAIRLTNAQRRIYVETGSRANAKSVTKLDCIAQDKRLSEAYLAVIKDMAVKYQVA